jgi:hypothetical protein
MRPLSAIFDSAILPIAMAKDFFTLGGMLTDDEKSATRQQIEKIEEHLGGK